MAKADGDSPDSDKLKADADEPAADYSDLLSDEVLAGLEAPHEESPEAAPADEVPSDLPLPDESVLEALDDSVLGAIETEPGAEPAAEAPLEEAQAETKEEEVQPAKEKKPFKLPRYFEPAAIVVIAAILLGIAALHVFGISTAVYLIAIGLIPYAIWKGGNTNNVYTVLLGFTLAAVVTAAFLLWLELERYHLDIKAREARQRAAISQRHSGSDGTPTTSVVTTIAKDSPPRAQA